MEARSIGIREFRERLAEHLLNNDQPIAITRHGVIIGYFIPARTAGSEREYSCLRAAAASMDALLEQTEAYRKESAAMTRQRKTKARRR